MICVSLRINDENLFMCLLAIYALCWKKVFSGPLPIFKLGHLFFFFLLVCLLVCFATDFKYKPLLEYVVCRSFHFVHGLHCWEEAFYSYIVLLVYLLLLTWLLVSNPKNNYQGQCQGVYVPCIFFLKNYGYRSYNQGFNLFWVDFLVWCNIEIHSYSFLFLFLWSIDFCIGLSSFPSSLV